MPYSLLISLTDLPCSLSSNICRLNSFVYCFRFITIIPVLLYNLLYFYPYLLSQILYQIQSKQSPQTILSISVSRLLGVLIRRHIVTNLHTSLYSRFNKPPLARGGFIQRFFLSALCRFHVNHNVFDVLKPFFHFVVHQRGDIVRPR